VLAQSARARRRSCGPWASTLPSVVKAAPEAGSSGCIRRSQTPSAPSAPFATMDHHPGQDNPGRDRPMMSAMTTVARIWSARARSGRPPSRPQTMLTVLTQTPPFISGNRACEPGCTGVGALATIPQPPRSKRLVFVPALVLAGAPIGALPTSCRRYWATRALRRPSRRSCSRRSPIVLSGRHGLPPCRGRPFARRCRWEAREH
jgi:hypothetical protein